jgi:hypothetical protein
MRLVAYLITLSLLAAACLFAAACDEQGPPSRVRAAKFGIFYGGQVQERSAMPFELDRAQQVQGIHLELAAASGSDIVVRWELDMPITGRRARDARGSLGASRRVRLGQATLRADRTELDQPLYFEPGDPLGIWNVRVFVDDELIIDRSVLIYDRESPPPEALQ